MKAWPPLILVNGPSSAGKSTLARALQAAIPHPYLVTGFDDFIFMSAPRYYRGADTARQGESDMNDATREGVQMIQVSAPGAPLAVEARFGPVFRRILDAMAPAVRALIDRGNAVIFDHVLHDAAHWQSYRRATAGLEAFTVGVTCPIEVLEARERSRGDRVLGRARGLMEVVHSFCGYDVTVDTGASGPEECAAQVLDALAVWRGVARA